MLYNDVSYDAFHCMSGTCLCLMTLYEDVESESIDEFEDSSERDDLPSSSMLVFLHLERTVFFFNSSQSLTNQSATSDLV